MAGPTVQEILNSVLTRLNDDSNSTLAALAAGSGSNTYTLTSTQNLVSFLNDAKDDYCRTAYAYPVTGTLAVSMGGGPSFLASAFTPSAGSKAINSIGVLAWTPSGGTKRAMFDMSYEAMVDQYFDAIANPPSGVPKYWSYDAGGFPGIRLPVLASTAGVLTIVAGYGLPSDFSASSLTATLDFVPGDRYLALVFYICAMVCLKRVDDPQMVARYPEFARMYDLARLGVRSEVEEDFANRYLQPFVPFAPPMQGQPSGG